MNEYKDIAESVIAASIDLMTLQFSDEEISELPYLLMAFDLLNQLLVNHGETLGGCTQETKDWISSHVQGCIQ